MRITLRYRTDGHPVHSNRQSSTDARNSFTVGPGRQGGGREARARVSRGTITAAPTGATVSPQLGRRAEKRETFARLLRLLMRGTGRGAQ